VNQRTGYWDVNGTDRVRYKVLPYILVHRKMQKNQNDHISPIVYIHHIITIPPTPHSSSRCEKASNPVVPLLYEFLFLPFTSFGFIYTPFHLRPIVTSTLVLVDGDDTTRVSRDPER
jgi:hypothetical protein